MSQPKNFNKIPESILAKLKKIRKRTVVAGCVKNIRVSSIRRGDFSHLGISLATGKPNYPKSVVPPPECGKYSRLNVEGKETVRRDLPMITQTHSVETPNWGDWFRGSHSVTFSRDVYQRGFLLPRDNQISVKLIGRVTEPDPSFAFRFTVSEVMETSRRTFKEHLLFNLNLLMENIGAADIFPSDATLAEYLKTLHVAWEILPPGERDKNIARIARVVGDTPEVRKKIRDRYDFFEKLRMQKVIVGHGGFEGYFGAKFPDNLVVFEKMLYGNAIYVMFKDWAEQSKRTKTELISSGRHGKEFIRVPHRKGWKGIVKGIIRKRISKGT